MVATEKDIMIDIADEDLPNLAEMYQKHKNWTPHVYSIIVTGMNWKKTKNGKYMTFMSPNGSWREDGTFFVLLKHYSFDIFLFSLDDTGKNIYEGIKDTKRLNSDEHKALLFSVQNKFYSTVLKALKEKGITISTEYPAYMYSISIEDALKFEITCPPEVYIKKLDDTHAAIVSSVWPLRYKDSDKFIALLIRMNGGYGLFLKSSDELVSWAVVSMLGQPAFVQTVDSYKKKGYASLIVKYISKETACRGHNPFCTVTVNNEASIAMFEKLGFHRLGSSFFSYFE